MTSSAITSIIQDEAFTSVIARFDALAIRIQEAQEAEKLVKFNCLTPAGNKAARSHIYQLRKLRSSIDTARKEQKAGFLEAGRKVDEAAKVLAESITEIIDKHQAVLDDIDAKEAARKASHQAAVDNIIALRQPPEDGSPWTFALANERWKDLTKIKVHWEETPEECDYEEFTSTWLGELNIGLDFFETLAPSLKKDEERRDKIANYRDSLQYLATTPDLGWDLPTLDKREAGLSFMQEQIADDPDLHTNTPETAALLNDLTRAIVTLKRITDQILHRNREEEERLARDKQEAIDAAQQLWEDEQEKKQADARAAEAAEAEKVEKERKEEEDKRVEQRARELATQERDAQASARLATQAEICVDTPPPGGARFYQAKDVKLKTVMPKNFHGLAVEALVKASAGMNRRGIAQAIVDGTLHEAVSFNMEQFRSST